MDLGLVGRPSYNGNCSHAHNLTRNSAQLYELLPCTSYLVMDKELKYDRCSFEDKLHLGEFGLKLDIRVNTSPISPMTEHVSAVSPNEKT